LLQNKWNGQINPLPKWVILHHGDEKLPIWVTKDVKIGGMARTMQKFQYLCNRDFKKRYEL